MAGGIARGDVRLCRVAAPDKRRPVVVLTRDSALGYLATATVALVTSSIRDVPSAVRLSEADGMKQPCAVNLHHVVTVDQGKLGARVAHLSPEKMDQLCAALRYAQDCGV